MDSESKIEIENILDQLQKRLLIANILLAGNHLFLVPTVLEDILQDCQHLVEKHCVKEEA